MGTSFKLPKRKSSNKTRALARAPTRQNLLALAQDPGLTTGAKEWLIKKLLKPLGLTALQSIRNLIDDLIDNLRNYAPRPQLRGARNAGRHIIPRSMPMSLGQTMTTIPPVERAFTENGEPATQVVGEEYIFNFDRGNQTYRQKVISCNPLTWVGTRAAKLAKQWIAYSINGMSICYYPACPSTTTGNLMMSTRNTADNVPTGFQDATRYYQSKTGAVWTSVWSAGECVSHEPTMQRKYKLDMLDMPDTGDWVFTIFDSINDLVGSIGLGMVTIKYDINMYGRRNTTLGLEYSSLGIESLNIVNSTMAYDHRVGTILYLINELAEKDLGGIKMTNLDRVVIVKNTAGTSTFEPLDTRHRATDLLNTGGVTYFEGFEPADEY